MTNNRLVIIGSLVCGCFASFPAYSLDTTQQQSTTVEKTTIEGDPTVIQHIESKMEPTVVQSRLSTDPTTGEKQNIVQPMIMERHDRVLDTTIIQPEVTEVKMTKETVSHSYPTPITRKTTAATKYARQDPNLKKTICKENARFSYTAKHKMAHRFHANQKVSSSVNQITETTEVVRQPMVKETIIQSPPQNNSNQAPQIIQTTESK